MDSDTLLCNECGKCFKEEASLLVHYSKTHDKRCFTCGKCGDEIIGKQNHLNHMRKHKNAIPKLKKVLKCDKCPYEASTKSNLNRHQKSAHKEEPKDNNFSCGECKYVTGNKNYLKYHIRFMHTSKEGMWICMKGTCEHKPKQFINDKLLNKHQKIHGDHACSECEKKFGTKRSLKRHQKKIHKRSSDENDISENSNETQNDVNLKLLDLT